MIDIFEKFEIDLKNLTCHSGGAVGSDNFWDQIGSEFGVKTRAYSYKTKYHNSPNKVEISEEDYLEGVEMIKIAKEIKSVIKPLKIDIRRFIIKKLIRKLSK